MGAQLFIAGLGLTCAGLLFFYVVLPIWYAVADGWRNYVTQSQPVPRENDARSEAFTNTGKPPCTASEPPRTERTPDPQPEPGVQIATLDGADLQVVIDALERRGYVCLSPAEQGIARDLVYHTERAARFEPAGERSKTATIERATGMKRGGSKDYQRASRIYDTVIGKPPPAVANIKQEATA